jgi:hypothetical protein
MVINMVVNITVNGGVIRCVGMGLKVGSNMVVNTVLRIAVNKGLTIGINGMGW